MTTNRFFPRFRYISDITNAQQAVVTFTEKRAKVLEIGDFTITIDIDTMIFNEFIYPVSGANTPPVCVPVASGINSSNPFLVFNILDDAFDNVRIS